MKKENYSVLQNNNLGKEIKIKLSNDKHISGVLKGYNNFEVHIEKGGIVYTINKGAIMYMYLV